MYSAGTVVAGKYRIERTLGQGGMGMVVAATDVQLGTPVALKLLHEDLAMNRVVVERLMREARASAELHGENVCRVFDVGATDTGCPFIAMELLTGQDLATVLAQNGVMPVQTAVEIIMQACLAIGEAHALGIVHRDLRLGNLMWTARSDGSACIKVLDFGVAKAPEELDFNLTQTSVIGSPAYMSPEQLSGANTVDHRSDIWSLGIMLYEMVSGQKPFAGDSITELAQRVALDPMPPLTGIVPPAFEQLIACCLEKEPANRFGDVAQLASALGPFLGPRGNDLAWGVARLIRGEQTPPPVAASAAAAASAPAAALAPALAIPHTPTTLREASGMVDGVRARAGWKLPAVLGLGTATGIIAALLMIQRTHETTPAASPVETTKMETTSPPPAPAQDTPAPSEAAKEGAANAEATKAEAATAQPTKAAATKADAAKVKPATAKVKPATAEAKPATAEAANAPEPARRRSADAKAGDTKSATSVARKAESAKSTSTTKSETKKRHATPPTKPPKPAADDIGESRF